MKLYPHQELVLNETENKNRCAYFLDMGLGKTYVGSEKMFQLHKRINLIICQKSKVNDWEEHFQTNYRINAWDITTKKGFECFFDDVAYVKHYGGCVVGIINYELAWRRPELLTLTGFTLMLDESSMIQNPKAKQTKFILKLKPDNVILLSGTPVSGKYENLWSQLKLLGYRETQNTFLKRYVNFVNMDFGFGYPVKVVNKSNPYKNTDEMKQVLKNHGAVFMKTEDVMTLPEQTFIPVHIEPSKEYKRFMKTDYVKVNGVEFIGDTSLTKRIRARQLSGSYNKEKINAYLDILNSTNDRLIVFYSFTEDLKKLSEVTTRPVSIINGETKDLRNYEEHSDSVTFVQYQSGAMGLNLQKANKIIYFTPTERCEHWMQSQKRIHRIGQKNTCFYYMLTCKDSIEEKIYEALKKGRDYTDALFKEQYQ